MPGPHHLIFLAQTSYVLGHSISFTGWSICQWVRKVSLGWHVGLAYIYKHLFSYLMSYQSVHFWVLFFFVPLFTSFSIGFVLHNYKLIFAPYTKVLKFVIDIHYKDCNREEFVQFSNIFFEIQPTLNKNVYDRPGTKSSHCDDYQHFGKWID